MHPDGLQRERDAMLAEIAAAFAGVRRGEGVSWAEAGVIDDYGTEAERRAARAGDPDRPWTELVDDLVGYVSWGWFHFLDPEGFRYYLPIALTRCVRESGGASYLFDETICFHLDPTPSGPQSVEAMEAACWSALSDAQRRCVAKFLMFAAAVYESRAEAEAEDDLALAECFREEVAERRRAYEMYWWKWDREDAPGDALGTPTID